MCDSAQYIGDMQAAFKNTPAFPPPTFRDTFCRIFKAHTRVIIPPLVTATPLTPPTHTYPHPSPRLLYT
jgi:hypothetical protein